MRTLSDEDVDAIARRVLTLLASNPAANLRPIYSVEEFAAEIFGGKRHPNWVRSECKAKRIKAVARKPWAIPQSEALRFMGYDRRVL